MNEHLARVRDDIEARRQVRRRTAIPQGKVRPEDRHEPLELAWAPAGSAGSSPAYFLVRYCPRCLRGQVIDMVRAVPEGTVNARELGLKRMQPWQLICPARPKNAKLQLEAN